MRDKAIDLIGACQGWGTSVIGTAKGPRALLDSGLVTNLLKTHSALSWREIQSPLEFSGNKNLDFDKRVAQITLFSQRLARLAATSIAQDHFPVILGGDHTTAIGCWSGIVNHLDAAQQFGLIWIDAHMDAHTRETTPSQAIHGMPLAVLLGYGETPLKEIAFAGAKFSPLQVVLIGVRSYEAGEAELLKKLNVKVYFMEDVKSQGFATIFSKALAQVSQTTKGFGISIDLDAFDPSIAPGVNAPVPGGLLSDEVCHELKKLRQSSQFKALEIAEYNPERDQEKKTARLAQVLIQSIL